MSAWTQTPLNGGTSREGRLTGTTQFTEAQMKKGPAICAGDACG
jgi:hypothetical protein